MSKLEQILAILPQTQCGLCQHKGCLPYANALLEGTDAINKCQPGGITTLLALSEILDKPATPYLSATKTPAATTVYIDSKACIGCTKCIQVCPVDAISGTAKANHVVITNECTGCNLCLPVCPVDCMHEQESYNTAIYSYRRTRFEQRELRLKTIQTAKNRKHKLNKNLIKDKINKLKQS